MRKGQRALLRCRQPRSCGARRRLRARGPRGHHRHRKARLHCAQLRNRAVVLRDNQHTNPPRILAMPTFCHADLLPCQLVAMRTWAPNPTIPGLARGDFRLGARCEGPGPVLMPFSQGASLSCRPFTIPPVDTPARGLHGGSDRATDTARPVAPARCSPSPGGASRADNCNPHASLPCRISAMQNFLCVASS